MGKHKSFHVNGTRSIVLAVMVHSHLQFSQLLGEPELKIAGVN